MAEIEGGIEPPKALLRMLRQPCERRGGQAVGGAKYHVLNGFGGIEMR